MNRRAETPGPRRWVIWGAGAGVVVLGLLSMIWAVGRDGVDKDKAALRARGEKLTFEELAIPWLTNGAPRTAAMVNAVNAIQPKPAAMGLLPLMELVAPGRARRVGANEAFPIADNTAITWQETESALKAIEPQLRTIRESLSKPEPDFGVDPKVILGGIRRPYIEKRMAVQLLSLDALCHLHGRRLREAAADLHALVQAAHLHEREPTLVAQMVNIGVLGLGLHTTWEALQEEGWTDDLLAGMQRDWESIDVPGMMERAFVGERALGLAYFELLRTRRPTAIRSMAGGGATPSVGQMLVESVTTPISRLLILPGDERLFLATSQARVEQARLLGHGRPLSILRGGIATVDHSLARTLDSWQRVRYPTTSLLVPNAQRAFATATRNMTLLRMGIVAIALERYRLGHQAYPDTLDQLVPGVLRSVPPDPESGGPLRYRAEPGGGFRLWSVGADRVDQGGDGSRASPGSGVLQPWDGKDFVWPAVASQREVEAFDQESARRRSSAAKRQAAK
jgi:type II secretory pathway pseudopilin PulG